MSVYEEPLTRYERDSGSANEGICPISRENNEGIVIMGWDIQKKYQSKIFSGAIRPISPILHASSKFQSMTPWAKEGPQQVFQILHRITYTA